MDRSSQKSNLPRKTAAPEARGATLLGKLVSRDLPKMRIVQWLHNYRPAIKPLLSRLQIRLSPATETAQPAKIRTTTRPSRDSAGLCQSACYGSGPVGATDGECSERRSQRQAVDFGAPRSRNTAQKLGTVLRSPSRQKMRSRGQGLQVTWPSLPKTGRKRLVS